MNASNHGERGFLSPGKGSELSISVKMFVVFAGIKLILGVTEFGLAVAWGHQDGIMLSIGLVAVACCDAYLVHARHLTPEAKLYKCRLADERLSGDDGFRHLERSSRADPHRARRQSRSVESDGYESRDSGSEHDGLTSSQIGARGTSCGVNVPVLWRGGPYALARAVWYAGGTLLCLVVLVLVAVRIVARDPGWTTLPESCGTRQNCATVRPHDSYRVGDLEMPSIPNVTVDDVVHVTASWVRSRPRTHILRQNGAFLHARFFSKTWAFPDDFAMLAVKVENGTWSGVEVWALSQSRIGTSDFGVNPGRLRDFILNVDATDFSRPT